MTPDERRETPEQRRKRIIDDCYIEELTSGDYSEFDEYDHYDAMVAYFDNHEPAVADAIRYGLTEEDWKRRGVRSPEEWALHPGGYAYRRTYSVNYPQPADTSHKEEA